LSTGSDIDLANFKVLAENVILAYIKRNPDFENNSFIKGLLIRSNNVETDRT